MQTATYRNRGLEMMDKKDEKKKTIEMAYDKLYKQKKPYKKRGRQKDVSTISLLEMQTCERHFVNIALLSHEAL